MKDGSDSSDSSESPKTNIKILESKIQACDTWIAVGGFGLVGALTAIPFSIFYGNKVLGACSFCWILSSFVQVFVNIAMQEQESLRELIAKATEVESDESEDSEEEYYFLPPIAMN